MSVLRYFLPNGGDILLNFTHIMDFFAEWKAADSENNFLYHLFWFLYYNNQFKMHNNFKQTKIKRTGQSPLKGIEAQSVMFCFLMCCWVDVFWTALMQRETSSTKSRPRRKFWLLHRCGELASVPLFECISDLFCLLWMISVPYRPP